MEGHTSLSHLKTRLIEKQASQLAAKDAEIAALKAENTSLREQVARLSAPVSELKRHAWFDDFRPIINAIGEISVQEAMDAIEHDLE